MTTVALGSLPAGADGTFTCPWKEEGKNAGIVLRSGVGSVQVRVANQEGDGWDTTHWSRDTQVTPVPAEVYRAQGFGKADERNRSSVESPVKMVHRICTELAEQGKDRKAMIEECVKQGINENTAKTQYYAWRKQT